MPRTAAKAVIIRDRQLLVIAKRDAQGDFFILPGGGQNESESLADAVRRECIEEIGTDVEVGELLFVRDYIARNHEFANEEPNVHQVEVMFACSVPVDYVPRVGQLPDDGQEAVAWLPLDELAATRLYPAALKTAFRSRGPGATYLGDVN
jgi:ADP-ribose pyrophosphatase YjhB (NUDIX family)